MMKLYYILYCIIVVVIHVNLIKAHYTQQWAVHIEGGSKIADEVAADHGFINHGLIFQDYYHFTHSGVAKRSLKPNAEKRVRLAVDTRVKWAQQQYAKKRVKRDNVRIKDDDPKWPLMWYLNRGNGLDMNVIPAWLEGITGRGAVVTILDDGLEKDHPDLVQNYDPMASYDVNNQDSDPSPRYDIIDSNRHGTRCAGEVAATNNNSVCALGIAHGAHVGGVRMLDGEVTDAVEARSLSLNPHHIDIYSASWGPDDDGKTVDGPGELAKRAFEDGVKRGRDGKGSIFVWASGNGGREHDNCNCDGYTNSIFSLSISSATEHGQVPWYSEACSSTLATTYSSGAAGEKQVVTTDLRHSCTVSHTGTSASAPLAAGICALALEANTNLTWRDMQHIVVRTARPQNLIALDWQTNGVGRNVSHSFGYGLMDAYAMVQLARKWVSVPEQHKCEISMSNFLPRTIPAKSEVELQLNVKECEGVQVLEHVQARLTISSQKRGDLNIQLTSPMGTQVTLLAHRVNDNSRSGFNNWPFMSVHSWGESPIGDWKLKIHNDARILGRATLQSWTLVLYGTKTFYPTSNNNNDYKKFNNHNNSNNNNNNRKVKSNNNSKKKNKKLKNNKNAQKYFTLTTKVPKSNNNNNNKSKQKLNTKEQIVINRKTTTTTTTTDRSPYFYSISNSKIKLEQDNVVKQYLKFVKNITITYPIMIPARDFMKTYNYNNNKKTQKLKEKSRDINSNRNIKVFVPKTTTELTLPTQKTTAITKEIVTAEIRDWDLILYGTSEKPAYDLQQNSASYSKYNDELGDNTIDRNIDNWISPTENRKDTYEVEGNKYNTSGCVKANGNICLECSTNYNLRNGVCVSICPEKYYNYIDKQGVNCLPCHYTCKKCIGPLDYQCSECYNDSNLYKLTSTESYCYPLRVINNINDEIWYHRIFNSISILLICVVTVSIYLYIRWKFWKRTKLKEYDYEKVNTLENIREMERKIKSEIYSDSE